VSEEENIAKKNKVRTKKKSENIINIGEDEDDDEDDVMEPRKKEGEMLFAQEALKESSLEKPQEHEYSTSVTDFLGSKYIHLLKKKSVKFPRARWFCRLCEYHCDNLTKCGEHFRDNRHSRLSRVRQVETTLYHLPRPNKHHLDSLNSLLLQVEKEHGLSQADLEMRKSVADNLHGLLNRHIPGCTVRLYGSSLSGFGLKTSNVNLDLQIVADSKPHLALLKTLEVLQSASDYIEVVDDFTAKIPHINFKTGTGLDCELSLNNCNAFQTSGLLADYWQLDSRVRVLGVCFRHWAHTTHLDRQAEGTLPPHTFAILLIYFLQQQTKPVLPCIHDLIPPAEASEETYVAPREALAAWRTQSQASPAELWIELFGFYSIGYKMQELVVSIRKSGALTREDKQWKTKRLAVEDPFSPKRNLSRSIQATSVYDFISDCLKTGYLYFGTIQTSLGPIITRINIPDSNSAPSSPTPEEDPAIPTGLTLESWLGSHGTSLTEKEALAASSLVPRNMIVFSFLQKLLTNGHLPAIQCCVCSAEGHMGSNCPEEQLPPLTNLPSLTPLYLQLLDSVCDAISKDWEPQEPELRDRDFIVSDLNRYIQKIFPTAQLSLFGSSSNGFAFRQSDLDISLTFTDHKTSDELDCIQIIETLCEKIKRMVGMRNVTAITSAKVPIVKLYHQKLQIDADISLYNVLARENTRMLCLYSDVDIRVKQLGYMVKFFAKVCDIGDASRGSLSSYAYILMMIFYLQQCSPPVIPVLQEMYKGEEKEKPENMVDGWNAWFMSDRRRVVNEWPGYRQNKQTVGQLWIGFLDFYARQFDDRRLVVAIKQQKPLSKFEKMWNSPCIAIEDPFELNHNLGAGISRKMNLYIKKAFINARRLFGTPFKVNPPGYKYIQDYFFDPQLLTDGAPPNDRGCRACGKIGHLVADCPRKKASDQRRKREREERQRSNTEDPRNRDQRDHQDGGGRNRSQSEIVGVGQIKAKIEDAKNKGKKSRDFVEGGFGTLSFKEKQTLRDIEQKKDERGLTKGEKKLYESLEKRRINNANKDEKAKEGKMVFEDFFDKAVKDVVKDAVVTNRAVKKGPKGKDMDEVVAANRALKLETLFSKKDKKGFYSSNYSDSNSESKLPEFKKKGFYSSNCSSSNSESKLPERQGYGSPLKGVKEENVASSKAVKINNRMKGLYSSYGSSSESNMNEKQNSSKKTSMDSKEKSETMETENCDEIVDEFNYNDVKETDSVVDYLAPLKPSSRTNLAGTAKPEIKSSKWEGVSELKNPQKQNKSSTYPSKDGSFQCSDIRYREGANKAPTTTEKVNSTNSKDGFKKKSNFNDGSKKKSIFKNDSRNKKPILKLYSATSEIVTLESSDMTDVSRSSVSSHSMSPEKIQKIKNKNELRKKVRKEKSQIKKERKMADQNHLSMDQSLMNLAQNYDQVQQCKSAESDSHNN